MTGSIRVCLTGYTRTYIRTYKLVHTECRCRVSHLVCVHIFMSFKKSLLTWSRSLTQHGAPASTHQSLPSSSSWTLFYVSSTHFFILPAVTQQRVDKKSPLSLSPVQSCPVKPLLHNNKLFDCCQYLSFHLWNIFPRCIKNVASTTYILLANISAACRPLTNIWFDVTLRF